MLEFVEDEGVGEVLELELELVRVPCVLVLPWGVLEVVEEEGAGEVPLVELVGVSCKLVLL
jgi:hypothetical protein